MAQNVKIAGAIFPDVPAIRVPDENDVYHAFTDVSDTTATAADVAQGKLFFDALGVLTTGTASGGGGGLDYETGIWTPAEDTTRGTINFSNSHGLGPTIYVLRQADGAWPTQTQTATGVTFINVFKLTGHNFHYSSGVTKEAVSRVNYVGSNLSGNLSGSTTWIGYDTNEPSDNSSYAGFYASKYGLYPYGGSRYWRSAIAYKWLAIWL